MENIIIPVSALPNLTESIKRAIGLSIWNLTKISCEIKDAAFLLKTPEQSFLLDNEGGILRSLEDSDDVKEISRVFFEGYSFPSDVKLNSISNTVCR